MTKILGNSIATAEQMNKYLLSVNPNPKIKIPSLSLCQLFLYIGFIEGVRGDILFAQSCKETGHFSYGGTVVPEQNNYAGLGTTNATTKGAYFPDEATGILAQAQHAKAYATFEGLTFTCVDPRYDILVKCNKIGTASHWEDLGGTWAVPGYNTKKYSSLQEAKNANDSYGHQIIDIYNKIISMPGGVAQNPVPEVNTSTTVKTYTVCIDSGHKGNYNMCPANPAYYESVVMWKLTHLQKSFLEKLGVNVILTRDKLEEDLALKSRGMCGAGCDLFISNHTNAVGNGMNESVDYAAVYYLENDTTTDVDERSKEIAELLSVCITNTMGLNQKGKALTRKSENDRNGDGIMNDNYYGVLHGARLVEVPGLILEHSFHTNTRVVNWLLNDVNLAILAEAEARCIYEWLTKNDAVNTPITTPNVPNVTPVEPAVPIVMYKVQLGAFRNLSKANELIARLKAKGYEPYIHYDEVKKLHKVQIGLFSDKKDAVSLRQTLINQGFDTCFA